MNKTLQLWDMPLRVSDALQRAMAQWLSSSPNIAANGFAHRADAGGAAVVTDILTRLVAVLLCGVNAVIWWVYAESRLMGTVWAIIAIGVAIWTKRELARR